jgi:nicotinamidase-related amidase
MPRYDPATTALVLIDLQKGILRRDLAPHGSAQVLAAGLDLAARFRAARAPVVLVHVDFANRLVPSQDVDSPSTFQPDDDDWSDFVDGLRHDGDIVVTKHHWGAFTGTDLDLQLRRRGVKTIVLGGVATNFGVESTARSAWEHSYHVVTVEDACASATTELHRFAFEAILPRLGRVVRAADVVLA